MEDANQARPTPAAGTDQPQPSLPRSSPPAGISDGPPPDLSPFRTKLTPEQAKQYAEDTRKRGSRARPSPTIAKHRDMLAAVIPHKPNKKVLFADLIAVDPDALAEFGEDGYKAFNARLTREL